MVKRQRGSKSRRSVGTAKTQPRTGAVCVLPVPISELSRLRFRPWGILKEGNDGSRLYIDIDQREAKPLREMWYRFRVLGVRFEWIRYDRTDRGWHIVCQLTRAYDPVAIVAMQAVFGSDPERESFNLARVIENRRKGASAWKKSRTNILFSRKIS